MVTKWDAVVHTAQQAQYSQHNAAAQWDMTVHKVNQYNYYETHKLLYMSLARLKPLYGLMAYGNNALYVLLHSSLSNRNAVVLTVWRELGRSPDEVSHPSTGMSKVTTHLNWELPTKRLVIWSQVICTRAGPSLGEISYGAPLHLRFTYTFKRN